MSGPQIEKVEWDTPLLGLVPQLRRLQYAANMLNFHEFCDAAGWPRDEYTKAKFVEFQKLGRLHVFDDHVLNATVRYYEDQVERREALRRTEPDYSRDHVS
jgi:hypothetical protein